MNSTHYTEKAAQKAADKLNIGRDPGPWSVEKIEGAKFWQRRYEVAFTRPDNY